LRVDSHVVRKRLAPRVLPAVIGVCLLTAPSDAHHSYTAYDESRPILLRGVVTEFRWENPHILIFMEVKDNAGRAAIWIVEGSPPGRVRGSGMKNALKRGDVITVGGMPARNSSLTRALGYEVTLADGRRFIIGEETD
jgi:hypothetical protein